jgi:DNA repair protein RadC
MIGDLMHEEFWVLYLNKANKLIEAEKISSGGLTGTVVDVKIIMNHAVQKLASAIALSHNHPSGNLQPSDADISLTRKMKDAGKLLDILVIDHLIIGDKNYYSFADNGLI